MRRPALVLGAVFVAALLTFSAERTAVAQQPPAQEPGGRRVYALQAEVLAAQHIPVQGRGREPYRS